MQLLESWKVGKMENWKNWKIGKFNEISQIFPFFRFWIFWYFSLTTYDADFYGGHFTSSLHFSGNNFKHIFVRPSSSYKTAIL